jgi:hypothetical protein
LCYWLGYLTVVLRNRTIKLESQKDYRVFFFLMEIFDYEVLNYKAEIGVCLYDVQKLVFASSVEISGDLRRTDPVNAVEFETNLMHASK